MMGIAKVFVKDLYELSSRPYLGIGLILVPLALLYVAGQSIVNSPQILLLLNERVESDVEIDAVADLLHEFAEIKIERHDWAAAQTPRIMGRERAQLALVAADPHKIFVRPMSSQQQDQLRVLAYQIAASLSYEKPWQVETIETAVDAWQDGEPLDVLAVDIVSVGSPSLQRNVALIPKIIALVVVFIPFLLSCSAIIRDKLNQLLPLQLVAPGVGWLEIVAGKAVAAIVLGTVNLFVLLIFSAMTFGVVMRSGAASVIALQLLAMLASTLLGLAASTLVKSQLQAYFIAALYAFSLIFLSGLFYPIEQALPLVQVISNAFPLTFSHVPLTDWMLYGLDSWPYRAETIGLMVQCIVAGGLALLSHKAARARI